MPQEAQEIPIRTDQKLISTWSPGAIIRLTFVSSTFGLESAKAVSTAQPLVKNGISLKLLCGKDKLRGHHLLMLLNLLESIGCSEGSCCISVDLSEFA